jgi:hypothetical protein
LEFVSGLVCVAVALATGIALPLVALVTLSRLRRDVDAVGGRLARLEAAAGIAPPRLSSVEARLAAVEAALGRGAGLGPGAAAATAPVAAPPAGAPANGTPPPVPRPAPAQASAPSSAPTAPGSFDTAPGAGERPAAETAPAFDTAPGAVEAAPSAPGFESAAAFAGAPPAAAGAAFAGAPPAAAGVAAAGAPAAGAPAGGGAGSEGAPAAGPPPSPGAPPGGRPPVVPPPPAAPPRRPMGADALGVWALAIPGGLALLLAAIFALGEAIAAGYVGPGFRFALGAGVGATAVLMSEIARGRRYDIPAAALGGGGAGIFYAVIYAGHARYGLFGQEVAFGLMVATSAVTLLAAERRNSQFMATLALIGGYLTPILLSTGENKAVAFFGYLTLLDGALLWAAGRRRWTVLVGFAGLATAALYLGWLFQFRAPDQVAVGLCAPALLAALFLRLPARRATRDLDAYVGAAAGLLLLGCAAPFLVPADPAKLDRVSGLALAGSNAAAAWMGLAYLIVVTLGVFGVAVRRRSLFLEVAGVFTLFALLTPFTFAWGMADTPRWLPVALALGLAGPIAAIVGATAWPALVGMGSVLLALASIETPPPLELTAAFVALLAVATALIGHLRGPRWALVVGAVATALPLYPALRLQDPVGTNAAWFAGMAVAYAAFAFPPFWRPRPRDLPGALSAALAGPAFFFPLHRVWVDTLGDAAIGVLPILLGLSTLLAAVTLVRAVRVRADDRELAILVVVVLGFAAGAVPLQLSEAWLTVGWAVEVALLGALSRRLTHPSIRVFAGALAAAVAVRLLLNPDALEYGGGEGMILLNWTLYTWGVPAVCLLVAAHLFGKPELFVAALRATAVLLFFALVNLEVAHAFAHDDTLSFTSEDLSESMTRSIAWASYGVVLIGVGIWRESRGARLAGLGFALLGAFKVFVVDLWSLSGFARVGSFAGLAVTLLVGAVAFQRIVLKDRKP